MADLDLQLVVGSKGDKGDTGAKGDKGDKGDRGEKGEKGATGATGPAGPIGPQGPRGETGDTGATGPVGPTGPQGARGEAGPTGATGPQGPAGSGVVESSAAGIIAHAEDAFAGSGILGLTVEGAYSQQTTTGLQLLDVPKTTAKLDGATATFDGEYFILKNTATGFRYPFFRLNTHLPASSDGTRYALYVQGGRHDVAVILRNGATDLFYIGDTGATANTTAIVTQDIDTICFGIPPNTPEFKIKVICAVGASVTTWEPYTGGKPSPSPDYPQDITVIENPTVKVAGKNLWPFASSYTSLEGYQSTFVEDKTPFTLFPGVYTFSAAGSLGNTDAPLFGYTATGERFLFFRILHNTSNPKYTFTVTERITSIYFVANAADSNTGTISNIQLERNSTSTDYKPHTSQSLTFTLPAEHPYLAKLPDGTADEIEVDEAGNVELVANVGKLVLDGDSVQLLNWQAQSNGYSIVYRHVSDASTLMNYKKFLVDNLRIVSGSYYPFNDYAKEFGNIHFAPNKNLCVGSGLAGASQKDATQAVNGWLKEHNATVYYALENPKAYVLSKIEMPAAPDSIINVWTDAELPTQSTVNYFVEAGRQVSINRERIKKLEQEGSAGIEVPVPINKGGTGATSASAAFGKLLVRGRVQKGLIESFNDATEVGTYTVDLTGLASVNGPVNVYGYGILEVYGNPAGARIQRYSPHGSLNATSSYRCTYERQYWNHSWGEWYSKDLNIATGLARTAINGVETIHVNASTIAEGILPLEHGGTGATNTIDAAAKLNVPYIGAPDSSIEIPKGADLNAYTTIGTTYCAPNLLLVGSFKNCPVSVPFSMFVSSAIGTTVIRQTLLAFNTSRIFSRIYTSSKSTWSSWEAVGAGIRSIGNGLSLSDAGELSAPEPPASDVDLSKATGTLPLKNGGTGVTSKNALIDTFYLLGLGNHGTIGRLLDSKSVTQPQAPGRWYVPAAISQEMGSTSSLGKKPALLPDGFFVTAEAMVYTGSEYGNAGNNGFRWTVEAPSGIVWVSDSTNTTWRCLTPIVRLDISSISNSTAIVSSTFWSDLLGSTARTIDPTTIKDMMRVLAPFTIQLSYPTVSSLTWSNSWVQVGGIQATTATGTAITGITLAALTKGSSGYTAGLLKEHDDYMLRPIGMPISFNTHASFAGYTGLPNLPAIFANM